MALEGERQSRTKGVIHLWLDDLIPPPPGWVHVRSVNCAIEVLEARAVALASLDHDLGVHAGNGGNGTALVDWMASNSVWPLWGVRVHARNSIHAQSMLRAIDHDSPYALVSGVTRGHFEGWLAGPS